MVRIAEARGLRVLPVDLDPKSLGTRLAGARARARAEHTAHRRCPSLRRPGPPRTGCRDRTPAGDRRRRGLRAVGSLPRRPRRRERGRVALQLRLDQDGYCPRRCTCPCRRCRPHRAHASAPGRVARTTSPRVRAAGGQVRDPASAQRAARLEGASAVRSRNRPRPRCLRNSSVKGFPGSELARKIRRRPSAPLLALLARRLRRFDLNGSRPVPVRVSESQPHCRRRCAGQGLDARRPDALGLSRPVRRPRRTGVAPSPRRFRRRNGDQQHRRRFRSAGSARPAAHSSRAGDRRSRLRPRRTPNSATRNSTDSAESVAGALG